MQAPNLCQTSSGGFYRKYASRTKKGSMRFTETSRGNEPDPCAQANLSSDEIIHQDMTQKFEVMI